MVGRRYLRFAGTTALRFGALFTMGLLTLLVIINFADSFRYVLANGVSIPGFFLDKDWRPSEGFFGASSFIRASLRVAGLAIAFSFPGSLVLALFISEYADSRGQQRYLTILEILSSIPTVVYGLFALTLVTPILQILFGGQRVQPYNTLSAALVLSIFLTPQVTNAMAGALRNSRFGVRDAALSLGATRAETIVRIVVPGALPGLLSAVVLGFSRAFGEAVIVGMVAGSGPRATSNPLQAAETMTGFILRTSGSRPGSVYLMGSVLFAIALALNLIGEWTARRNVVEELR